MSEIGLEEVGDGRPAPKAGYLGGLSEYERPARSADDGLTPRERLLKAATSVFATCGFAASTVTGILDEAHSAPRTFYENFADKEECFRVVFGLAEARARELFELAGETPDDPGERLRSMVKELLSFVGQEPDVVGLLLTGALSASLEERLRREELMEELGRRLLSGASGDAGETVASHIARGVMGSIEALLRVRLRDREEASDAGQLLLSIYHVVLPYVGHRAASKEGF